MYPDRSGRPAPMHALSMQRSTIGAPVGPAATDEQRARFGGVGALSQCATQQRPSTGDCVGVAELVWREAAPHSCRGGGAPQLCTCRGGRPVAPTRLPLMTHSSGPTGSAGRMSSQG